MNTNGTAERKSWWKRRSGAEKALAISAAVMGIMLTAGVVAVVVGVGSARRNMRQAEAEARRLGLPLTLADVVQEPVPDEDNAAELYDEAARLIDLLECDDKTGHYYETARNITWGYPFAERDRLKELMKEDKEGKFFEACGEGFALMAEGARRKTARWERIAPGTQLMSVELGSLGAAARNGRLVSMAAVVDGERGEYGKAVDKIEMLLGMEGQLKNEPMVMTLVIRIVQRKNAFVAGRELLNMRMGSGELDRLAEALDGPSDDGGLKESLGVELVSSLQVLDMAARGETEAVTGTPGRNAAMPLLKPIVDANRAKVLEYWVRIWPEIEVPLKGGITDPERMLKKSSKVYMFFRMLTPCAQYVPYTWCQGCAMRDLLKLGTACRRFEAKKGRLPEKLEELAAEGLLEELPRDPFLGREYRYDGIAGGVGLWSIGRNMVDDEGAEGEDEEEGDIVLELRPLGEDASSGPDA
ncbi:MAG: hypothetical protein JW909_03745 [Planctomycetes bacterium]|nr:hypothetical protein [Planctomycetota bacterium]